MGVGKGGKKGGRVGGGEGGLRTPVASGMCD